ncbi:hypothetical protein [Sphingobacterium detergens]
MNLDIRHTFKKKLTYFSFAVIVLMLLITSCNRKKDRVDIIDKLVGTEVNLGNHLVEMNGNGKPVLKNYDYQIVLYTDSAGCMDCAFDLESWRDLMKQADTTLSKKIDFKFIFHPAAKNQLQSLLIKSNFEYPVYIDYDNHFYKENAVPEDLLLQCFLIDKENKILAVGNPIYRSEVWNYFKTIINGENANKKSSS